ncbi:lysophospholipid acyltransferase family protein [Arachidicoccus sp.]|jgi:1-acyl-sn-glycerol-3-phosphate acyltransferase|uniref:lysophospholipid acyltransferase family protein n=1 Tax=Arachidicoccus sp. TaxID=1872624 RepID=UPI003D1F061F
MKRVLKILQIVYSVYAMLLFVILMLIVVPFVFLSSLLGKKRGGNLVYIICRWWAILWYFFIFIRHKEIFVASHNKERQYIFVANHRSYLDIPELMRAMHQPVRVLGKHDLAKVPIFGIIYRAAAVLVDRSSRENRAKSVAMMKDVLASGMSIFIFPEGTFNETGQPLKDFYDGAFRIALETGTPIKPIIFPDTIKRFHYESIFSFTPGICRAIYLEELSVQGLDKTDTRALKQKVYAVMEEALTKFGI